MQSKSPAPVFLITEDGLVNIEVDHFPLAVTLDDVWAYMDMIIKEQNEYKTFVVDTLDWLEKLIFKSVCEEKQSRFARKKLDMVRPTFSP